MKQYWIKYEDINDLPLDTDFLMHVVAEHSGLKFACMCIRNAYNPKIIKVSAGHSLDTYEWKPLHYMLIELP